ncbi:hypothetical protein [Aureibacter tunicatorum]|uniref:Uncharacterized protein n=1 Tax=Aureibacter tunicatorum TaxID=866807 RepID=A0AAE3XQU7_9BACT|nr:hypothetical protein [Aureibacter tunicatorum]MDR6241457.1 hypothetical protein [Aureibacter tunicatorum]BDD06698.1 hypothetical protein AUTU_41810 [Aureibacter tunicatorum]
MKLLFMISIIYSLFTCNVDIPQINNININLEIKGKGDIDLCNEKYELEIQSLDKKCLFKQSYGCQIESLPNSIYDNEEVAISFCWSGYKFYFNHVDTQLLKESNFNFRIEYPPIHDSSIKKSNNLQEVHYLSFDSSKYQSIELIKPIYKN